MSEVLLEARQLVKGFRSGESYLPVLQQADWHHSAPAWLTSRFATMH